MSETTRLLLVRHAESEWNAAGRWQGQADPPLSPRGRDEAAAAAEHLRGLVEAVFTSDLLRARATGEIIAAALGLGGVEVEPDIKEVDVGEWSGLTMAEVEARYPEELAAWRARTLSAAPGGEDTDAFLDRVRKGLGRIAAAAPGRRVLVVTHGGCIGRLERDLDCFPGRGPRHLEGRWFAAASGLRPDPERVRLIPDPHEPAPESR